MSTSIPSPLPSLPAGAARWYVFFAKPRQEALANAKLQQQGYDAYVPMLRSWKRGSAGWAAKEAPMFPRYGFVRPPHASRAVGPAAYTPGVAGLVRFGTELGSMSAEQVQALYQAERAFRQQQPGAPLHKGDAVMFADGPLKGLSGIVAASAGERVMVLMRWLGADRQMATTADKLARASALA